MRAKKNEWLTHEYFRTYRIANAVDTIMRDPFSYLRHLEGLTVNDGIYDFLPHWQKESALHKFIRYVADEILMNDTDGPTRVPFGSDPIYPDWILPVDAAMLQYGIIDEPLFFIPDEPVPEEVTDSGGDSSESKDPYHVVNACYDYLLNLRWTQVYEDLMSRITDEVFYVMFLNRRALANLNEFLAMHVGEVASDHFGTDEAPLVDLFVRDGELKRVRPPMWARRAVFYRDRGRCTACGTDLSGLIDTLNVGNYDHMMPLARGGLNDVTNLQLLCENCNLKKADKIVAPSNRYRRWY
ncbi:HNH endonuclease signature motif containing protein [Streptomyces sp. DSM 3412]|uniref:HNH endonuclease signature motif containing protein n=1 Tax=Streptomyces gottesmaniae TaxID=3075518 RepID=A0ABU2Z7V4_9ACTN|nr:HNH endonuclease signature motif containing protein [Streptomyces sp. DSM 3412]MDT0572301.1 HNH endonuclease signature motif containing protein [Streptomyces sp. DSM 3412]